MAKYSMDDRRELAKKGQALPDGSFPIADVEDLKSAIRNWALGKNPAKAKKHIIARAKALNAVNVLPDKWNVAPIKHGDVDDFLAHYGVLGMKWGRRKAASNSSAPRQEHNGKHTEVNLSRKESFGEKIYSNHGKRITVPVGKKHNISYTLPSGKDAVRQSVTTGALFAGGVLTYKVLFASGSPAARTGKTYAYKALGDFGRSLPYSKIANGVYKVTTLK